MKQYKFEQTLLEVKSLNLSYGSSKILHDINFKIDNITRPDLQNGLKQGQVVALLGKSGCGKTQLFRCIAGLQEPSSGNVLIEGLDKTNIPGDVGVVQQSYPLFDHRTIWSNLKMAAIVKHKDYKTPIMEMLNRFGLADKIDMYPSELSGGQRQRIAIIQQMLCSTHLVLMDEPFSGLDICAKANVNKLINEVTSTDDKNTVFFTTHDIQAAVQISDHIIILGKNHDGSGSSIKTKINLIDRGLAWNPDVINHKNYWETVKEINNMFLNVL